jgi:hypothetical protein
MFKTMLRTAIGVLLSFTPMLGLSSTLEVDLLSGQVEFDVLIDTDSLDDWHKIKKGECIYYHRLTQQTVMRDEQFISGYLLQARLNCFHGKYSSEYYDLPELFVTEHGEASVSFSGDGTSGFYYSVKFI